MKQILFLSSYPTDQTLKDGMVQRIKNIDDLFEEYPRIYLDVKLWDYFQKKMYTINTNTREYKLNALLHFFTIWKLIKKSNVIYLHSIYGLVKIMLQLYLLKKKICLDMHGVVPQENLMMNGKLHSYYFECIERIAIYFASKSIYVSNAMKKHFLNKYPNITNNDIIYPIFANIKHRHIPTNLSLDNEVAETVFVYSGNLQKWQNIDELLTLISKYKEVENYRFIVLTGYPDLFEQQILKYGIPPGRVEVKCVGSNEIDIYYRQAHYGFILRSEHLINQVANPTKMIEYLLFGIIPVIKSKNIGDFNSYNYNFLAVADFSDKIQPKKSEINQQIAFKMLADKKDLTAFVLTP